MFIKIRTDIFDVKNDFLVSVTKNLRRYSVMIDNDVTEDFILNKFHVTRKKGYLQKIGDGVYERGFFKFLKWFKL